MLARALDRLKLIEEKVSELETAQAQRAS